MISERVRVAAIAAALLCSAPGAAAAQGAVSGILSLAERNGSSRGELRTAVVYLAPKAPRGAAAGSDALRKRTIAMRGREFIPHVQPVLVGGSVAFPNQDPFSHNVFSNVELGPFDLGLYRRGVSRSATFPRVGVYPIYCNIHSRMVSFVVAVPTPWFAQPDDAGRFRIPDVPAGTYTLYGWHERGGNPVTREVSVGPAGLADVSLVVDARAWVSAPHLNKFGRPYTVSRADRY